MAAQMELSLNKTFARNDCANRQVASSSSQAVRGVCARNDTRQKTVFTKALSRKQVKCSAMTESAADVKRVFNFSAGPAMLPVDVLEEAQADMLDWNGSGMSVMEMSHRGKEFLSIANKAEADLRSLLNIPETYKVLFVQGGASSQFSAIPLNLLTSEETIDVVVTGSWSKKAAAEMKKYCKVNVCAKPDSFTSIPPVAEWSLSPESKYVYFCANETIEGVEFKEDPLCEGKTLIADVSSNFLSKPINVENYGIVYGGVQKNIGPAGMAIVIVKESLLGSARADCPAMMDYKIAADNDSMYNTPPCWTMYMCGLVFAKLLREGGLEGMQERNQEKCKLVYDAIGDSNSFYNCPVDPAVQSCMNIPFTLADAELDKPFISEAAEQGLVTLKGHRSVGGMRASVYNAMPKEGCQKLADFMKDFQAKHA